MNFENIDMELYKVFYAVYISGSFSKAALELGVTQPSVSYNIKRLEQNLEVKLFERGNRLLPTAEGEALFPFVEEALTVFSRAQKKLSDISKLNGGQIIIGVPSHIGVFLLVDIIKDFNKKFPNIKIKVVCKPTKELFSMLNLKELDIIIDSSPLEYNNYNFKIEKISSEKCSFACNKSREELLNKTVKLEKLIEYPMIVPLKTSSSTKSIMQLFEKKEILFSPNYEIATSDMIAEMIKKNIGIGFLFDKTIDSYDSIEKIDIDLKMPEFDIFLIYKVPLFSKVAGEFLKFCKKRNL